MNRFFILILARSQVPSGSVPRPHNIFSTTGEGASIQKLSAPAHLGFSSIVKLFSPINIIEDYSGIEMEAGLYIGALGLKLHAEAVQVKT
ncbi:MAG TPA: hypothetical protein ENN79_00675 [Desulfobacteraceae bacterium]|nr:hypothetical protein [Desulfobacteraceae bacterium]